MSTFICAVCHLEYQSSPEFTEEDGIAEYEQLNGESFPGRDHVGSVCDTCFPKVVEWAREQGLMP